ncbi:MAG: hypothetical protein ACI80K_004466 [Paracoccaceae bacterium]
MVEGAGRARALSSRDAYESALGVLRASLVESADLRADAPGAAASRRRLSVILGSDDQLLGFAVRLAADGRPAVRSVGQDALLAQLNRWSRSALAEPSSGVFDLPRQSQALPDPLLKSAAFHVALDPNGSAPDSVSASSGASAFDLLDRSGGAPIPIVVDPSFVESMARRPAARLGAARIEGSWDELLKQLCEIHKGAYQLQGYRYPDESFPADRIEGGDDLPPPRAWIHVVQSGTTQLTPQGRGLRERGAERIAAWCRGVLTEGNSVRQSAAARAVAVLDWPAAVYWLERRWAWYGDVVALEGLMAAAARGRVAPSLQDPRCLRSILELVEGGAAELKGLGAARSVALAPKTLRETGDAYAAAAEALEARLLRVSLGLRELVPMLVASEERVVPVGSVLFEQFEQVSAEGQWLRLAVAEGLGVESPEAARAARAALEDVPRANDLDPTEAARWGAVRRQALRTLGIVQARGGLAHAGLAGGIETEPVSIARLGELFQVDGPGARDLSGLGLELARIDVALPSGFPGRRLLDNRESLTQVLILAALVADRKVGTVSEDAGGQSALGGPAGAAITRPRFLKGPGWAAKTLRAAMSDLASGPVPDVRRVERSALWTAARELRMLGGEPLGALFRWVGGTLGTRKGEQLESVLVQVGALGAEARNRVMERALADLKADSSGAGAADPERVERAWMDLAALVGDVDLGDRARRQLVESLVGAMAAGPSGSSGTSSMLVYAAELALRSLEEARLDVEAVGLQQTLQQAAQAAGHPLAQRFSQVDWPPGAKAVPRDLERLEPVHPPVFWFD